MSEFLAFWPKGAMIVGGLAPGTDQFLYTQALSTNDLTQVVLQLGLDLKPSDPSGGTASIQGIPQISNDGISWKDSSTVFAAVGNGTAVPYQETIKLTEIGAFMRIKVKFTSSLATLDPVGATIMFTGVGRS